MRESSLVWNYKYADLEFGRLQARDLLQHLCTGPISNAPVDIVQGGRSVEARPVSVSKGMALQTLLGWMRDAAGFAAVDFEYILCVGHYLGRDENLFTFLNGDGIGPVHKEHAHGHGHGHGAHGARGSSPNGAAPASPGVTSLQRAPSLRTVGFEEPRGDGSGSGSGGGGGGGEGQEAGGSGRGSRGASTSLLTNMVRVLDLEAERGQRIPGWRAGQRAEGRGGEQEEERLRERDAHMAAHRRRSLQKGQLPAPPPPNHHHHHHQPPTSNSAPSC